MPVVIDKILRAGEGKVLRKLKRIADQVNSIEEDFVDMSDAELRALTEYTTELPLSIDGACTLRE